VVASKTIECSKGYKPEDDDLAERYYILSYDDDDHECLYTCCGTYDEALDEARTLAMRNMKKYHRTRIVRIVKVVRVLWCNRAVISEVDKEKCDG